MNENLKIVAQIRLVNKDRYVNDKAVLNVEVGDVYVILNDEVIGENPILDLDIISVGD